MNRIFLLSFVILLFIEVFGQEEYNTIDYKNYQKANDVFSLLESTDYNQIDSLSFHMSGVYNYFGHLPVPRQRKAYAMNVQVQWSNRNASIKDTLIAGNDSIINQEYTENGIIMRYSSQDKNVTPKTMDAISYLPFYSAISVYKDILKHKNTLRYIGFNQKLNCEAIVYTSPFAGQVTVYINKQKERIETVEMLRYRDIEGDYYLQFCYEDYINLDEWEVPSKIVIKEWNEIKYEFVCNYDNIIKLASKKDSFDFKIENLAKNLYKINYPTGRHYSYVVDFGDYLGIIEAPINENYMYKLAEFVKRFFPEKPIKYCFLTHHHPDHAGGFPYFYNTGSVIVTTELSSVYQQELLNRKHSLKEKPVLYSSNGKFDIVEKNGIKNFGNKNIQMKVLEFGDNGHTAEFLLYYFPQYKMLIMGDLYYIKNSEIVASDRAFRLYQFINRHKLKVKDLYPTWMPFSARRATIDDVKKFAELFEKQDK